MPSIVKALRLLADEERLRLLLLLQQEELSVVELQEILGMGQARISAHLAELRQGGLVRDRRAGQNGYYALVSEPAPGQRGPVREASRRDLPEAAADGQALQWRLRKRRDRARGYFNQLAGKSGRTYCPGRTWDGLAHMLLTLVPPELVVADLGAGEGTVSQLLARRVRRVICVDNSEKMVEFGEALAKKHGFKNLEYRLGDLEDPPIDPNSIDLALLSQALHHAAHPAQAIVAAHRILQPGGRIAVL